MDSFDRGWRFATLLSLILAGLLSTLLLWPLLPAVACQAIEKHWSRAILRVLRIRCSIEGQWPTSPGVIAINHVSWLDILIVNAQRPAVFIAKADIARWPLLGLLARRAGTIFIERGRRHAVRAALHAAIKALQAGRLVAVFPEGTTSNGLGLLPFHGNLLQSAVSTGLPVFPIGLRYCTHDGEPSTVPAYVQDRSILHILRDILSTRQGFLVEVRVCEPLTAHHRQMLAQGAYRAIAEALALSSPSADDPFASDEEIAHNPPPACGCSSVG